MFDYFKNHKIILSIILFLLGVPFAFFGIDFYFKGRDSIDQVASVGGTPISAREFSEALQQRQEQLRRAMGGKVDQAMLDSPEVRQAVLSQLIDERVAYNSASKAGIAVTNAELQEIIASIPAFRENNGAGAFSRQLYQAALRQRNMSEAGFEALLRRDLIANRSRAALAETAFTPTALADRVYRIRSQQREVSQAAFTPDQMRAKINVTPAEAQAYYDQHKDQFKLPEQVKVEYVVLSLEGIQRRIEVAPEQLKQYFDEHRAQFQTPEERQARHILVSVSQGATPEQKAKAKERAEKLLAEAKQAPKNFAELARKNSEDPGSAAEGGDLGFFPRGRMAKPFDDAVFSMKAGEIVGPIETQFGYHIIQLEAIKPSTGPNFEQAKAQVEADLRKGEAGRRFAEAAEAFSNLVYEQPDSLQPVVEQFKLELQKSDWVTREGSNDAPLLNNPKLLTALFSDESIKDHRNTAAIEVAPNLLVSARVTEHRSAKERPFAEVQADVTRQLTEEKARKLAQEAGEAALANLKQGKAEGLSWSGAQMVSREQRANLGPDAAQAVFSADTSKLPAYAGVVNPDGTYTIYRISRVIEAQAVDPTQRKTLASQIDQAIGAETAAASLASQKQKFEVRVNPKALEKTTS
ncbi:MAG TPA: SurA N-terminal domain-containing protein [Burkholderiales bacterium]|nr:SurA N-terminal domain-containing protein [Burkholderiales bacterium]